MDKDISSYREKHHRCRNCKYINLSSGYYYKEARCVLKNIIVYKTDSSSFSSKFCENFRGMFCSYYKMAEEQEG